MSIYRIQIFYMFYSLTALWRLKQVHGVKFAAIHVTQLNHFWWHHALLLTIEQQLNGHSIAQWILLLHLCGYHHQICPSTLPASACPFWVLVPVQCIHYSLGSICYSRLLLPSLYWYQQICSFPLQKVTQGHRIKWTFTLRLFVFGKQGLSFVSPVKVCIP